jgi:hypothetical protein
MFQRIMRFRDPHGDVYVGELGDNVLESHEDYVGLEVEVYAEGVQPWDEGFKLKGRKAVIQQVRWPQKTQIEGIGKQEADSVT